MKSFKRAGMQVSSLRKMNAQTCVSHDAAAWVFFSRSKMGTFREIKFPRRSLSLFVSRTSSDKFDVRDCIGKTHCGSPRFPLFTSPRKELTAGTVLNPRRACGATI
jgi:hypothetical protein